MLEWALLGLLLLRGQKDGAVRTANANAVKDVTTSSGIKYRVSLLRNVSPGVNEYNVDRFVTSGGFGNFVALITYRQNANGTRVLLLTPGGSRPEVKQARKDFGV